MLLWYSIKYVLFVKWLSVLWGGAADTSIFHCLMVADVQVRKLAFFGKKDFYSHKQYRNKKYCNTYEYCLNHLFFI